MPLLVRIFTVGDDQTLDIVACGCQVLGLSASPPGPGGAALTHPTWFLGSLAQLPCLAVGRWHFRLTPPAPDGGLRLSSAECAAWARRRPRPCTAALGCANMVPGVLQLRGS